MRVAFVGDRYSALGFRLAGADAYAPKPHEAQRLLERLHETVEMMLLTPTIAEHPLTLIVPDAGGLQPPPDFAARIRRILGVESN